MGEGEGEGREITHKPGTKTVGVAASEASAGHDQSFRETPPTTAPRGRWGQRSLARRAGKRHCCNEKGAVSARVRESERR